MDWCITKELCNHLYLGQWEMIVAFFQSFKVYRVADGSLTKSLRIVAQTPSNASVDCQPLLLAWQSCNLLQSFSKSEQDRLLYCIVEFNILLHHVLNQDFSSSAVLPSLQDCFSKMLRGESPAQLSDVCHRYLQELFQKKPFPVHCLLSKLTDRSNDTNNSDLVLKLHQIYSSSLLALVSVLKSSTYRSEHFSESQIVQLKRKLLTILSLLPDSLVLNDDCSPSVSTCMYELKNFIADGKIKSGEVYGSLLGRKSPLLLQKFQTIEDARFASAASADGVMLLSDYMANVIRNEENAYQEIFLRMYNRKEHFLQEILNGAVEGILSSCWEETLDQLDKDWLRTLHPLVVCLAWKGCTSNAEAQHILSAVQALRLPTEPLQRLFVHLLQENVFVTEWISSLDM